MHYSRNPSGDHRKINDYSRQLESPLVPSKRAMPLCKIGPAADLRNVPQSLALEGVAGFPGEACLVARNHPFETTPKTPSTTTPKTPSIASHRKPSSTLLSSPTKTSRTAILQAAINRKADPLAKRWRTLWPTEKLAVSFEAAHRAGGLAFSLDFNDATEKMLIERPDATDLLRRRIAKEMRSMFGRMLPFSFGFEISEITGKLHIHGAVIPAESTAGHTEALQAALCRAGGKIKGKAAARQCRFKPLTDGIGWAGYMLKGYDLAARYIGTNQASFISTDMVRLAKIVSGQARQSKPLH